MKAPLTCWAAQLLQTLTSAWNCSKGRPCPGSTRTLGPRGAVAVPDGGHRFVTLRVEGLPDALEGLHPLGLEHAAQSSPHPVEAFGHRVRRLVDVCEGAVEAVGQVDEREQEGPLGLPGRRLAIALDPAPVVLEVRPPSQGAGALLLQLGSQVLDSGRLRGCGGGCDFDGAFRNLALSPRSLAHHSYLRASMGFSAAAFRAG